MRCVFDTYVLVSALLLPDSEPRRALNIALRRGDILLSFETLAEISEVLSRKRFRKYITDDEIRVFLPALVREAQLIDVVTKLTVCHDPKDDKFLELAVAGQATYLICGRRRLAFPG